MNRNSTPTAEKIKEINDTFKSGDMNTKRHLVREFKEYITKNTVNELFTRPTLMISGTLLNFGWIGPIAYQFDIGNANLLMTEEAIFILELERYLVEHFKPLITADSLRRFSKAILSSQKFLVMNKNSDRNSFVEDVKMLLSDEKVTMGYKYDVQKRFYLEARALLLKDFPDIENFLDTKLFIQDALALTTGMFTPLFCFDTLRENLGLSNAASASASVAITAAADFGVRYTSIIHLNAITTEAFSVVTSALFAATTSHVLEKRLELSRPATVFISAGVAAVSNVFMKYVLNFRSAYYEDLDSTAVKLTSLATSSFSLFAVSNQVLKDHSEFSETTITAMSVAVGAAGVASMEGFATNSGSAYNDLSFTVAAAVSLGLGCFSFVASRTLGNHIFQDDPELLSETTITAASLASGAIVAAGAWARMLVSLSEDDIYKDLNNTPLSFLEENNAIIIGETFNPQIHIA